MSNKEDLIEVTGKVEEMLFGFNFLVKLDNGGEVVAKGGGSLRKKRTKIVKGDRVLVELSKYDLNNGRLCRRIEENNVLRERDGNKKTKKKPGKF